MDKRVHLLSGNITSSLLKLALPIMATSLIQMAYNMTDMIWIGRVGSGAVTAIGTAGMYMWVSQGIAVIPKLGGQVKVAHAIGSDNIEQAKKLTNTVLQITVVSALVFASVMIIGNRQLIAFYNLSNPEIIGNAESYLKIISIGILFSYFNFVMTGLLTATGDSRTPFTANTMGLVINIVLDPLLIFGLGFFPALGINGAAIATITAQIAVSVFFIRYIIRDEFLFDRINILQRFSFCDFRSILKIGFPSAIQSVGYSFISMLISRFAASFGDEVIAVSRVGAQIESVSWMISDGISSSINTFIAQNYGAGNIRRAERGYNSAFRLISVWGLFTTLLLYFGAASIFRIFIIEPELLHYGVDYLRILGLSQLFMCYEIVTSGSFAGFGKTSIPSTIILIFTAARIPAAYLLADLLGSVNGVWWAVSLSSVFKGIILVIAFRTFLHRLKRDLA